MSDGRSKRIKNYSAEYPACLIQLVYREISKTLLCDIM